MQTKIAKRQDKGACKEWRVGNSDDKFCCLHGTPKSAKMTLKLVKRADQKFDWSTSIAGSS